MLQNKGIKLFWSKYINNIYEHGLWRKGRPGTMTTISNSYRTISWKENRVYTISKGHAGKEQRNTQKGNFGQYKQKVKKQENPSCLKRMGTAVEVFKAEAATSLPYPSRRFCHRMEGFTVRCLIDSPSP